MRSKIQLCHLIMFGLVIFVSQTICQNKEIKYKFEVNGKTVNQKFKVFFLVDGNEIIAKASKGKFLIPSKISGKDAFSVRFSSKKYKLTFNPIYSKDLDADWIIGIDSKPFETDKFDTTLASFDNVCLVQYLDFQGGGNILVMKIFNGDKTCVKENF